MRPVWSARGIAEAVKILLSERLPLFDSMIRQLTEYPDMKRMLQAILFQGKRVTYNPDNPAISLAVMFGYITDRCDRGLSGRTVYHRVKDMARECV